MELKAFVIKRFLLVVGASFVVGGGAYSAAYLFIKDGEAWIAAEKSIRSSSEVSTKYGEIGSVRMSFIGLSYSLRGGREDVSLRSKVEGRDFSGDVYVRLERVDGSVWIVSSLIVPRE